MCFLFDRIPNIDQQLKWEDFMKTVKTGELGEKYEQVQADIGQQGEHAEMMDVGL